MPASPHGNEKRKGVGERRVEQKEIRRKRHRTQTVEDG